MTESTACASEEIAMLEKTLERFVREEVIPLERANGLEWDTPPPGPLRRQVRQRARELGLYALDLPRHAGGGGLSFAVRCQLEMAARLTPCSRGRPAAPGPPDPAGTTRATPEIPRAACRDVDLASRPRRRPA
jgi:alkylation response protein AidB-like acyl-CoA dehydrogenase